MKYHSDPVTSDSVQPGSSTTQTQSHQIQSNLDQVPLRPSHIRFHPSWINTTQIDPVTPDSVQPGSSTTQTQSHQIQSNVIKTMIIVSAFYVITWTPNFVYYLLMHLDLNLTMLQSGYYVSVFLGFLYISANPFIYAIKFDPVKRVLVQLIPCKNSPQQPAGGSVEAGGTRTVTTRTACN